MLLTAELSAHHSKESSCIMTCSILVDQEAERLDQNQRPTPSSIKYATVPVSQNTTASWGSSVQKG